VEQAVQRIARQRDRARAAAHPGAGTGIPLQPLAPSTLGSDDAAGTTFLRWRSIDRSSMGVALWQTVINAPTTPTSLISGLYELEQHRIVLNMQISLTHSIARQAHDCAIKLAQAETVYRGQAIR
jgi:Protein of unknown function (DUF3158)